MDADRAAAEGAGVAAAGALAASAALVGMAARASADWPEAGAAAAQAESLRRRALRLGEENVRDYAAALRAFEGGLPLGPALEQAAEAPLRLTETAGDVALLAAHTAERCEPRFRADVLAAAHLAAGAAAAAAELVAANLVSTEDDGRVARAREIAANAASAIRL